MYIYPFKWSNIWLTEHLPQNMLQFWWYFIWKCIYTVLAAQGLNVYMLQPKFYCTEGILTLEPSRCIKASFYIPENRLNFPTTKGFRTRISMKLVYQYMEIFFNFQTKSNHLHPLQVENCDSNSRLVVDEDDNGKLRLERIKVRFN